ncbi:class I SAM-dependent methyltransferase [Euzebya rosea]|uniref:class I SAM-dependent methyltransferase n=1 Tax=Euzebya rosea TaxID=2052804 RepID=UPI000D3EAFD6|nr:methyltransferase domain-containing protein [Euzebya rosea]
MSRRLWSAAGALGGLARLGTRSSGIRDADGVQRLYDRLAGVYDRLAAPYDLIDGRRLQRQAIDALGLQPGDTVVDLGTGTGWNLPHLADRVGSDGRVIGVDLSERMLDRARRRVEEAAHSGVEFVHADLRTYVPPADTTAVIAAFALEMVPDHDEAIRRLVEHLAPGVRIASVGLREPAGWPEWAVRLGSLLNRPFGVTPAYRDIAPWTSIRQHLSDATITTSHAGAVYLAEGTTPGRKPT